MSINDNNKENEIDIFDFIEIIINKKYLMSLMIIVSVLLAIVYIYAFQTKPPKKYTIKLNLHEFNTPIVKPLNVFIEINKELAEIKNRFNYHTKKWFQMEAYKSQLSDKKETIELPKIKCNSETGYITLIMVYYDLEKGMKIIKDVVDLFYSTKQSKDMIKEVKEVLENAQVLSQLEFDNITDKYNRKKVLSDSYNSELITSTEKLKKLEADLEKSKQRRDALFSTKNLNPTLVLSVDENIELIRQYISFLIAYTTKLKYFETVTHKEVYIISKEQKIKLQNLENITRKSTELNELIKYEKPYYEEFHFQKPLSKYKIVGLSMIIGFCIGAFLSCILGIREKRSNSMNLKK